VEYNVNQTLGTKKRKTFFPTFLQTNTQQNKYPKKQSKIFGENEIKKGLTYISKLNKKIVQPTKVLKKKSKLTKQLSNEKHSAKLIPNECKYYEGNQIITMAMARYS